MFLLTFPRVLGFKFYPVSFWYCYSRRRQSAEPCSPRFRTPSASTTTTCCTTTASRSNGTRKTVRPKVFHVSPFIGMQDGRYEFRVSEPGDKLRVAIYDYIAGPLTLDRRDRSRRAAAHRRNAASRRCCGSARCRRARGRSSTCRRSASSARGSATFRSPSRPERRPRCEDGCREDRRVRALAALRRRARDPAPRREPPRPRPAISPGAHGVVELKTPGAAWRAVTAGALGVAEGYMNGDWDTPDLDAVLDVGRESRQTRPPHASSPSVRRSRGCCTASATTRLPAVARTSPRTTTWATTSTRCGSTRR